MRISKVLTKIRAGKPARIAWLGYFLPPFVAHAAHLGYDGIWLDLEHRPMDSREVQALLAFSHLYNIDLMIRTPTREKGQLYRYLEDGAAGIIVPHVSDVESARALVQSVKFPPVGDRGIEGRGLETNYGLDIAHGRDVLIDHALHETFLIVQIETPAGLAAADQIAALSGIDGLYVGPNDMRIRLQHLPEDKRPTVDKAIEYIASVCKKQGKIWGSLASSPHELEGHWKMGSNFLVWGMDTRILHEGLEASSLELDVILETDFEEEASSGDLDER
jgi:4-hydroxy-2-oxoheptanedioate aldolase